jgi:hypothetical protein
MTALYANGVRTVIIEKIDRLARDLMVRETINRGPSEGRRSRGTGTVEGSPTV